MKKEVLTTENLTYTINKKTILNDINLTLYEGEYVSVIGPNGAGKTTLLKCLVRILKGFSGTIYINGIPLVDYSQKDLAKLISYVSQADGRTLPFSVWEFVLMSRYTHLSPFTPVNKKDKESVKDALVVTKTLEFSERPMTTLSGGEKQKVFIAASLAQEAKILLLDEPTTFLDPKHEDDIYRILKRLNKEKGLTIISVTHDLNHAALLSQKTVALKQGQIVYFGHSGGIMNNQILKEIYQKEFLFARHPQRKMLFTVPEALE